MKNPNRASERRTARLIAFGVILYAVVMNLDRVGGGIRSVVSMFLPIILGCILALVLDVPMHGFENLFRRLDKKDRIPDRLQNAFALVLAVVFVPLLLFVVLKFIVPQFISAITNVVNIVIANEARIAAFVGRFGIDPAFVSNALDEIIAWAKSNLDVLTGTAISTVVSVFSSAMDVVMALILAIYILADKIAIKRRVRRVIRAFVPEPACKGVLRCGPMFLSTFRTFLYCQCLEALILGTLLLVCMLIFRIPYALTIACMTAVLALIPYLGAYISLAVGVVLVVTVSPVKALIFAAVFLLAQQIEGNVIYPKVVGQSVGLPAYMTLSAVVVGGAVAGVAGMFFVIPVVSVIYVLLRESVQKRNAEKDAAEAAEKEA